MQECRKLSEYPTYSISRHFRKVLAHPASRDTTETMSFHGLPHSKPVHNSRFHYPSSISLTNDQNFSYKTSFSSHFLSILENYLFRCLESSSSSGKRSMKIVTNYSFTKLTGETFLLKITFVRLNLSFCQIFLRLSLSRHFFPPLAPFASLRLSLKKQPLPPNLPGAFILGTERLRSRENGIPGVWNDAPEKKREINYVNGYLNQVFRHTELTGAYH